MIDLIFLLISSATFCTSAATAVLATANRSHLRRLISFRGARRRSIALKSRRALRKLPYVFARRKLAGIPTPSLQGAPLCTGALNCMPPMSPDQRVFVDFIINKHPDEMTDKERSRFVRMAAAYANVQITEMFPIAVVQSNSALMRVRRPPVPQNG